VNFESIKYFIVRRWHWFLEANLTKVNLSGTVLNGTNLTGANLTEVNLGGVQVTGEQLESVHSLECATMPDRTIYRAEIDGEKRG
jgi:hypothetical protein